MSYTSLLSFSFILISSLFISCGKDPAGPVQQGNEAENYLVSTFAGSGQAGIFDALRTSARFTRPTALAIDLQDNLYVLDAGNFSIRKITSAGMVTTLAGGQQGYADGTGAAAQFYKPNSIAADASGNVYVAEETRIRKITAAGVVTTLAGSTTQGYTDGSGSAALFSSISSIILDAQGNVLALDKSLPTNRIRMISASGQVSTYTTVSIFSGGITIDAQGNLYVIDEAILDYSIVKITPAKVSSRFAISPRAIGITIFQGTIFLTGLKSDLSSADTYYGVYKINPGSSYTLVAGEKRAGFLDGNATNAQFSGAAGIAADGQGNLFVADSENNRIRKVSRK